jgi:hypothetical protein
LIELWSVVEGKEMKCRGSLAFFSCYTYKERNLAADGFAPSKRTRICHSGKKGKALSVYYVCVCVMAGIHNNCTYDVYVLVYVNCSVSVLSEYMCMQRASSAPGQNEVKPCACLG